MKTYWVAHTRGPDFVDLERKGFVTLYPSLDDYVFLETTEANQKFLNRQTELGLAFMKDKGKVVTITQEELDRMKVKTAGAIGVGAKVEVIQGTYASLSGEVLKEEGGRLFVRLVGYNRHYEAWVNRTDVVPT